MGLKFEFACEEVQMRAEAPALLLLLESLELSVHWEARFGYQLSPPLTCFL